MKKTIAGFIIGLIAGTLVSLPVAAGLMSPKIVGGSGYLTGYDVENDEGEVLCDSPYISVSLKTIQCE